MKRKVLAGLVVVGVLGISGAAFAGTTPTVKAAVPQTVAAKKQPPQFEQGQRPKMPPAMSRDNRMPPPPGAHSRDKRPPEFNGKRPPMSMDKRPPMPPRSGDRRPPEFRK